MKTLALTTAILLAFTVSSKAADGTKGSIRETRSLSVRTPEFVFGTPEDLNTREILNLKYANLPLPSFDFGKAEDIDHNDLKRALVTDVLKRPEFVWGSPDEVKDVRVLELNGFFPAVVKDLSDNYVPLVSEINK